ncbi:histone deacetylase 11 [Anabrus simplex]|uniref:histone deacetylase 11 n=1 Tax=Anabrus simplex TaxID=316456 RepID=UPI0034DDC07D
MRPVKKKRHSRPPYVTKLYFDIGPNQLPIIYRKEYNVHFVGLEKLHPFDASKWGHIFQYLKDALLIDENTVIKPNEASLDDLLLVHTVRYLKSLKWSWNVAMIAEIPPLAFIPNCMVQASYLKPMRFQTGGSILAGKLALERGWAINIGGGFHHCSKDRGGGFCPYADITLLIQFLFQHEQRRVKLAMIVDLDAHQGNGHEHDFTDHQNVYILDIYNGGIYPRDKKAKRGIRRGVPLPHLTEDREYLHQVETNLEKALSEFHPDIMVYNAGTDILDGDRLGLLAISPQGIIRRDELVFMKAHERRVPIVMLTSGGYLKQTARIIADSILNLFDKGLISGPTGK